MPPFLDCFGAQASSFLPCFRSPPRILTALLALSRPAVELPQPHPGVPVPRVNRPSCVNLAVPDFFLFFFFHCGSAFYPRGTRASSPRLFSWVEFQSGRRPPLLSLLSLLPAQLSPSSIRADLSSFSPSLFTRPPLPPPSLPCARSFFPTPFLFVTLPSFLSTLLQSKSSLLVIFFLL